MELIWSKSSSGWVLFERDKDNNWRWVYSIVPRWDGYRKKWLVRRRGTYGDPQELQMFDSEKEAKAFCEVRYRMGV